MHAYDRMPDNARVWIYASSRILTAEDQQTINEHATRFLASWTAHDVPVDASFDILNDVFLVIMANGETSEISGCGIDKSVAFMKNLGQELGLDFFNRLQIEVDFGNEVKILSKGEAIAMLQDGRLDPEAATFNKQVSTCGEFKSRFRIPVSASWFYPALKAVN